MSREAIATWSFAMVVRERKHGQLWYLPAGRVERGDEVAAVFRYVLAGGAVYPLALLSAEGAPWEGGVV